MLDSMSAEIWITCIADSDFQPNILETSTTDAGVMQFSFILISSLDLAFFIDPDNFGGWEIERERQR